MAVNNTTYRRKFFIVSACFIPLLGLIIRAKPEYFPLFLSSYTPDVLWAFLVFALAVSFAPRLTTAKAAAIGLAVAYLVECSQIYQAPFINDIRDTRIGGLLLGHGFLWSDLLCYTIGIMFGVLCDWIIRKRTALRL